MGDKIPLTILVDSDNPKDIKRELTIRFSAILDEILFQPWAKIPDEVIKEIFTDKEK